MLVVELVYYTLHSYTIYQLLQYICACSRGGVIHLPQLPYLPYSPDFPYLPCAACHSTRTLICSLAILGQASAAAALKEKDAILRAMEEEKREWEEAKARAT